MGQQSFWGHYDIRAVVSADFGPAQYKQVGATYAHYVKKYLPAQDAHYAVAVGHDARLHSPEMVNALIEGLLDSGLDVVSLGLSTSPIVYFSEYLHPSNPKFPDVVGTLMVTASHNPSEYNGIKFTFQKRTLEATEFQTLKDLYFERCELPFTPVAEPGKLSTYDVLPEYFNWFEAHFGQIGKGIKVVVDSGNATAGIAAPGILQRLGCEVVDIFTEPDGRFPNHHPDPSVYQNLTFLMDKVVEVNADFGIAFDGDTDRLGVVDERGTIVPGDQITLFLTDAVLASHPGATIVFDIKSTQTVLPYVRERNGNPFLAPSGHAYMKRVMLEKDIPLGGELSGHIFFRDRHWGFDDAIYAACRFLESFAKHRQSDTNYKLSQFAAALPHTIIAQELRVHCPIPRGKQLIQDLETLLRAEPNYFGSPITELLTMDGLRANIENGFFLVRCSSTEPCITLRWEAPNQDLYAQIERRIEEICQPVRDEEAAKAKATKKASNLACAL